MINRSFAVRGDRLTWALALLTTLIALFTHLYGLADLQPVPYYDPAYNGLDALRIVRRGVTPIFFPANGGREPLFIYLQALALGGLGVNNFALRLPGALAGALAIPAVFGFARSLFGSKDQLLAKWVPAWVSLGLALSVWHVSQTRLGLRGAALPLTSIGVLWLFISGWRRARLGQLAASGALLGLTIYTYTAARFLPFVLFLVALPDLVARPTMGAPSRRSRWLGFGALALASIIVFAPLGWYYLHHPITFADRASSVMIWNVQEADTQTTLAAKLMANGWSTVVRFARFPVPLFAGLVIGLGLALARLRRLEYRLLLLWWLVMLLPDILTIGTPHLLRSLGAAPASYLLIAVGLGEIAIRLPQHPRLSANVILVAGLLLLGLSSFPLWDYFHPVQDTASTRTQALVEAIAEKTQTSTVYLPLSTYADPSLRFLLATRFKPRADWSTEATPGLSWLVQPTDGSDSPVLVRLSPDGWITLLPPLHPDGQIVLQSLDKDRQPIANRDGTVIGYEIMLPDSTKPEHYLVQPSLSSETTVVGLADLVGYSADSSATDSILPRIKPGSPLQVTTFWRAHGGTNEDYDMVVHLVDDAGQMWGYADGPPAEGAYSTSLWLPGEQVADWRLLWVDPQAPPGRYWLNVAFYDYAADSRLPVVGSSSSDTIRLGPFKLPLPPITETPTDVQPQTAQFGNVIQLLGYRLVTQPTGFALTLYWQASSPISDDFTVFVHMLDEKGQLLVGHDAQPVSGRYPTSIWEPGEVIPDEHTFDTTALAPGEYRLEVGMYMLATGKRLSVTQTDGTQDPDQHLMLLSPINVQ